MPAVALVLLVVPLLQGSTSPLTPGARVRATAREPGRVERTLVGSLRTFDSEKLTLSTDESGNFVALPRPTITRLEISRGRKGHTLMGLLLGTVLGLSAVALKDAGCEPDCDDTSTGFIVGAVAGGALVGAGIGTMVRSERWESLPWAVGPARRAGGRFSGPGLRLTLRF